MKTTVQRICLYLTLIFVITSCQEDPFSEDVTTVEIKLKYPAIDGDADIKDLTVTLRDAHSDWERKREVSSTELEQGYRIRAPYGTYIATAEGKVVVGDEEEEELELKAYLADIVLDKESANIELDIFVADAELDARFVFKEIFFAGTKTPEDEAYGGDKYFILYNNSTEVLYADGLIIAQSAFHTTTQQEYTPDIMDEAFTSNQIIMLPGSGTDYPVNPGEQIVIANSAIDHREHNINSFDLTDADFEIVSGESDNADNPDVPNIKGLVGTLLMNDQGITSYVLAKLPEGVTAEQFVDDNVYTYAYTEEGEEVSHDANKVPNEYVMDAVNISVQDGFDWLVTSPALDMGWTYGGTALDDDNRFGKAVIRKEDPDASEGTALLQDTNNSTDDFEPASEPSLK